MLVPGIQRVQTTTPPGSCLVAHSYPASITDSRRGVDVDVNDCTVFTVTHQGCGERDYSLATNADAMLEQALQAISEVTLWSKANDEVGRMSAFLRQHGRLDVKYFFLEANPDLLLAWRNPLFSLDRGAAEFVGAFLGNMVMTNGPAANPLPSVVRRTMSALDLINLGFYTESFVSLFAQVDDLAQEVINAGMARKGLTEKECGSFLGSIKEQRLRHYLGNVAKLCDWKSLAEADGELAKRLDKVNSTRNRIMHGSTRLGRDQAIDGCNTLLEVIGWLRTNPFGYVIPAIPKLQVAHGEFFIVPDARKDQPVAERSPNDPEHGQTGSA